MADDETRAMAEAAKAAPANWGLLKQKAMEQGLPVKDFILYVAEQLDRQPKPQEKPADNSEVTALKQEISEIKTLLRQQAQAPPPMPTPQASGFGAIGEFASAMRQMKEYENSLINGYTSMRRDIMSEIQAVMPEDDDEPEAETPEEYAQKTLFKAFADRIRSSAVGGGLQQAQSANTTLSSVAPVANSPSTTMNGVMNMIEIPDKDIPEMLEKLPAELKEAIQADKVSLAQFQAEADQRGFTMISDNSIEKLYTAIKKEGGGDDEGNGETDVSADKEADAEAKDES